MTSFEYPSSLIAQFPEDVYRNVGAADVLPHLTRSLDVDKVRAIQFLRSGWVYLTFADPETCEEVLLSGIKYDGLPLHLAPADSRFHTVHLCDLPVKVDDQSVISFFSDYGEVLAIKHKCFKDFPSIKNCNRAINILLSYHVPGFVCINDFDCRVWYTGQLPQCSICHTSGHRAPACPLSGLCRRCRRPGHVARDCVWAWDPPASVSTPDRPMDTGSSAVLVSTGDCSMDEGPIVVSVSVPAPVSSALASVPVPVPSPAPVPAPVSSVPVTAPVSTPVAYTDAPKRLRLSWRSFSDITDTPKLMQMQKEYVKEELGRVDQNIYIHWTNSDIG